MHTKVETTHQHVSNNCERNAQIIELDMATTRSITKAIESKIVGGPYSIERNLLDLCNFGYEALTSALSESILEKLQRDPVRASAPVLVVRGCVECGQLPETPVSGFLEDSELPHLDAILLGLLRIIGGMPIQYPFENEGRYARNVVPNPNFIDVESSWGSQRRLSWHQDNNFQPFEFSEAEEMALPPMPRYLAFIALRNFERVGTQFVNIEDVLQQLSQEDINILQIKAFQISSPESVSLSEQCNKKERAEALLEKKEGVSCIRLDTTGGVRTKDQRAKAPLRKALKSIERMGDNPFEVVLRPGDCMIFDNYRVLHRREAFEPFSITEGRWLRRIYGVTDQTGLN